MVISPVQSILPNSLFVKGFLPQSIDYLIEDVLQRAFIDERLVDQKSKVAIDFPKIAVAKKGKIDVEEYKMMFAKNKKKTSKKKNKR